jgi:Na+-transporting NADH:ubiquinone oxidoreductase subunit NqrC
MFWIILGIICLTCGILLATSTFVLSSSNNNFSTKDRIELYTLSLLLYVGGIYGIISNVCPGT